jgi:hypothetical protein
MPIFVQFISPSLSDLLDRHRKCSPLTRCASHVLSFTDSIIVHADPLRGLTLEFCTVGPRQLSLVSRYFEGRGGLGNM